MNAKTIKSLYNGEYTCIERPIPKDSKYNKTLSKCTNLQEKLTHLVDKETFSLINNVLDYLNELSIIDTEEAFIEGFFSSYKLTLRSTFKEIVYPLPPYVFPESFNATTLAVPLLYFVEIKGGGGLLYFRYVFFIYISILLSIIYRLSHKK